MPKKKESNYSDITVPSYAPKDLVDSCEKLLNQIAGRNTTEFVVVLLLLVKRFRDMAVELSNWRSLWCDRPEDRLYHAKDRTWWSRRYGKENSGHGVRPETPYRADPPEEIMVIVRAARRIKRKGAELKEALSHFPE